MASEPPSEPLPETPPPPITPPPIALPPGMVARIKGILLSPREEWAKIDAEPATTQGIMTGWVLPLAAIGPLAALIGSLAFGYSAYGVHYYPSLTLALVGAVSRWVLAVVGVYVLALVIDALAPSFGGQKDSLRALKVAAYGSTASFLSGIFAIVPALAWLGILGLYSLYLIYLGLPALMRAPQEKAMGYVVVTILVAIVLSAVAAVIVGQVTAMFMPAVPFGTITYTPPS